MKFTIDVEENHVDFLLELLQSLDYVSIEMDEQGISEEHKQLLEERIKAFEENPYQGIEWSEVKKKLHIHKTG